MKKGMSRLMAVLLLAGAGASMVEASGCRSCKKSCHSCKTSCNSCKKTSCKGCRH